MHAVDTNVIVRYLVADDDRQFARADAILGKTDVFVPVSVLLEVVWVLGSSYGFRRDDILGALQDILGLPGLQVADAGAVARALEWYAKGLDFADAIHLAQAAGCERLLTFDRAFIRSASGLKTLPVSEP